VGVVTQESHFFHESVRGQSPLRPTWATDAELRAACRTGRAIDDLIAGLPDGYDTSRREARIPVRAAAKQQRLALARIVLRDARIVCI